MFRRSALPFPPPVLFFLYAYGRNSGGQLTRFSVFPLPPPSVIVFGPPRSSTYQPYPVVGHRKPSVAGFFEEIRFRCSQFQKPNTAQNDNTFAARTVSKPITQQRSPVYGRNERLSKNIVLLLRRSIISYTYGEESVGRIASVLYNRDAHTRLNMSAKRRDAYIRSESVERFKRSSRYLGERVILVPSLSTPHPPPPSN